MEVQSFKELLDSVADDAAGEQLDKINLQTSSDAALDRFIQKFENHPKTPITRINFFELGVGWRKTTVHIG